MNLASCEKTFYNINKWFLYAIFLGLPLVINNGYFNISATKSLYYLFISINYCVVALIAHLIYRFKKIKVPIKAIPLDFLLIAFAVANIVSAGLSKYGKGVWLGTESRIQGAITILIYVLVYLLVSNGAKDIIKNSKLIRFFSIVFIMVVTIAVFHSLDISFTGIFTHMVADQRPLFISTIGNLNFFSSFICLCLPIFVVFFVNAKNQNIYTSWAIVLSFGGIAAVLSCSDGFVLGFLAFLAVAPFFFTKSKELFIRFWIAIAIILLSAAAFFYLYKLFPKQIYETSNLLGFVLSPLILGLIITFIVIMCVLAHFKEKFLKAFRYMYLIGIALSVLAVVIILIYANREYDPNAKSILIFNDNWGSLRGLVYRKSFEILSEFTFKEWLVGIGPETLQFRLFEFGLTTFDQAHCEYLQVLLTTGLIGFITYIGSIIAACVLVIRKLKDNFIALAFFFGLVAYWAQAIFSIAQSFTTPFVYLYLAIIVCEYKQTFNKAL